MLERLPSFFLFFLFTARKDKERSKAGAGQPNMARILPSSTTLFLSLVTLVLGVSILFRFTEPFALLDGNVATVFPLPPVAIIQRERGASPKVAERTGEPTLHTTASLATATKKQAHASKPSPEGTTESFARGFCALANHPVWEDLHKVRLDKAQHEAVWQRVMLEVIVPEVLLSRPALQQSNPPPIPEIDDAFCKRHGFGALRSAEDREKRIVIDIIYFGIDVDMLELRIMSLLNVVDYFIIYESTLTHRGMEKGAIFKKVQTHFEAKFKGTKIIYKPEVERNTSSSFNHGVDFKLEQRTRRDMVTQALSDFPNDTQAILISGDLDEIPARETLIASRSCQMIKGSARNGEMCTNSMQYQYSLQNMFKVSL